MFPAIATLMTESNFRLALCTGYTTAGLAFVASIFINSPYGRFASGNFGIELNPRVGWWAMEIMATVSFIFFFVQGPHAGEPVPRFFAALYLIHYANRGWYFPYSIRVAPGTKSSFSLLVVISGVAVTSLHGYLNATWYSKFCPFLTYEWLSTPTCMFGLILYEVSFLATLRSEYIMRNLRKAPPALDSARYKIPRGFLFEYVTSPQYFTELMGFLGWTIMTLNPAGLFIFLISCANLIPRAISTHAWYHAKFVDYPKNRKILVPFCV